MENESMNNNSMNVGNRNQILGMPKPYVIYLIVCTFLIIIVMKIVSCVVFSQIDLIQEMNRAQNPPQVKIEVGT